MNSKYFLSVAVGFILAGCNYNIDKTRSSDGPSAQTDPKNKANLNFANVMQSAIATSCLECHSSPRNAGGVNLETYENVFSKREAIAAAVRSGAMPKNRTMPQPARDLLLAWIEAGAPREAASPNPTPTTPTQPSPTTPTQPKPPETGEPDPNLPSNLNFQTVAAAVLQPVCMGCHASPDGAAGVNVDVYDSVFANRSLIMSAVQSGSMPRRRTLTPNQKTLLLNWLAAGAPRDASQSPQPVPAPTQSPTPAPQPPCDEHRHLERGDDSHDDRHDNRHDDRREDRCEHRHETMQLNLEENQ